MNVLPGASRDRRFLSFLLCELLFSCACVLIDRVFITKVRHKGMSLSEVVTKVIIIYGFFGARFLKAYMDLILGLPGFVP